MKNSPSRGYQGDNLAEITGSGSSFTISTLHTDHLGSTAVISNSSGAMSSLMDYHAYGNTRLTSGSTDQKTFIGQYTDSETSLSCLNARYYEGSRGQFISQDPVFWEIGLTKDGQKILANPQAQNSYSYAGNNPIKNSDPTGRIFGIDDAVIAGGILLVAQYGPQITNFLQSLTTPLGQFGMSQAAEDAQKGNYGWAAFGVLTSGELPAAKITPVFDGLWTAGKTDAPALNAINHAVDHAAEFGIQSSKDYVKSTRDFITRAINEGFPAKLQEGKNSNILRTYDAGSNTFSAFEVNKSTNAVTPKTMFKPSAGANYFSSQPGSPVNIKSLFSN